VTRHRGAALADGAVAAPKIEDDGNDRGKGRFQMYGVSFHERLARGQCAYSVPESSVALPQPLVRVHAVTRVEHPTVPSNHDEGDLRLTPDENPTYGFAQESS
jgi:hypothetical protein